MARSAQQYWTDKKENVKWAELKKEFETQSNFSLGQTDARIQLHNAKQRPEHTYKCLLRTLNGYPNWLIQMMR